MPDNNIYNERELLLKIAQGDEGAFTSLLRAYQSKIYSIVLRLTGDQWMAEEVVQDSFLKVWLKRESLPSVSNFNAWLGAIAENMTLDAIKRSKRKKNSVADWISDFYLQSTTESNPEDRLKDILQHAINKLSRRQKQAFELIKIQGYSREEAATSMNVSEETVKSHLEQAVRNVRAYCLTNTDNIPLLVVFVAVYL